MKSSEALLARLKYMIKHITGALGVIANLWSLRVYCGYIADTMHWVDKYWVLHNLLLDFIRFLTPHNCAHSILNIIKVVFEQNYIAVTTENDCDMCPIIEKMENQLNPGNNTFHSIPNMHTTGIGHVLYLAFKYCSNLVHHKVPATRALLLATCCSVTHHDRYETTQKQFRLTGSSPTLDAETRCSSAFHVTLNVHEA